MEFTKELKRLTGSVRKAVEKYNMIENGDKIAIGVSGGKDSLALVCALASLKNISSKTFELCAIYVDTGLWKAGYKGGEDAASHIEKLCNDLSVPLHIISTDIAQIVFTEKEEKNPCSLCAKMRRGALQNTASELGYNKLALGHHKDDAVETFMMNLFNEGRIGAFPPVNYFDRSKITLIRPLVETPEKDITYFITKSCITPIKNPCPMDKNSERERVKQLLRTIDKDHKGVKNKIFGAMERAGVDGYKEK